MKVCKVFFREKELNEKKKKRKGKERKGKKKKEKERKGKKNKEKERKGKKRKEKERKGKTLFIIYFIINDYDYSLFSLKLEM